MSDTLAGSCYVKMPADADSNRYIIYGPNNETRTAWHIGDALIEACKMIYVAQMGKTHCTIVQQGACTICASGKSVRVIDSHFGNKV